MSVEELHAVLITIHGDTLLLPNSAVVEVLGRDALRESGVGPEWLLGSCELLNREIPVVRFETLNGVNGAGEAKRERIVVLNSIGRHLPNGQVAIIAQGYPHLVSLNRAALHNAELHDSDRPELVLARVTISSRHALIPDLETVEAEIARARLGH